LETFRALRSFATLSVRELDVDDRSDYLDELLLEPAVRSLSLVGKQTGTWRARVPRVRGRSTIRLAAHRAIFDGPPCKISLLIPRAWFASSRNAHRLVVIAKVNLDMAEAVELALRREHHLS